MKLLENKTALVTGASRGIGRAIALKFAEEGADVAFTFLSSVEKGQALVAELEVFGVKAKHQYVMWFHYDGNRYTIAELGVAVSDKPTGPFVVQKHEQPDGHVGLIHSTCFCPSRLPRMGRWKFTGTRSGI